MSFLAPTLVNGHYNRPLHSTPTAIQARTSRRPSYISPRVYYHSTPTALQVRPGRRPSYASPRGGNNASRPGVIRRTRPREAPAEVKQIFDENPDLQQQDVVALPPPKDEDVLDSSAPSAHILNHGTFVIGRQLEMMNVFLGYEQSNKYSIRDLFGTQIGFIAEHEGGLGTAIQRQLFRTHRQFTAYVLDQNGNLALKIYRPFTFINSKVFVFGPNDELIGSVQQIFHVFKRQYDLFVGKEQFAKIDAPFLSWDFSLHDRENRTLGTINRNFSGLAREIFTDTGVYVLRMSGLEEAGESEGLSLDERAVSLAAAVTIDFDFFSRHSGSGGGGFLPFFWFFGGDE